jgi:hypothetical protein
MVGDPQAVGRDGEMIFRVAHVARAVSIAVLGLVPKCSIQGL